METGKIVAAINPRNIEQYNVLYFHVEIQTTYMTPEYKDAPFNRFVQSACLVIVRLSWK